MSGKRHPSYRPLFPYFGGKAPVASIVWEALGDVANYVEPFFGSGAVLFLRPGGPGHIETVNDADGLVANFWRAVQQRPDEVAFHADNPVNECDLHARHLWLIGNRERITERLMGDPEFCDPKAAGWWAWGMSCWIGSGWCSGTGPWGSEGGEMVLRNPGQGVNRQLPHLGDPGQERIAWLAAEIGRFARRLRNVRVCSGDWSRERRRVLLGDLARCANGLLPTGRLIVTSFASLMARPCVTPDISTYRREGAHCTSVDAVATWMAYERSDAWWLAPSAQVRHAAVYWLAMREIVTGEVLR